MPNIYKSELMKKYIKNDRDVLHESTGVAKNSRILITGMSGGGKTNALIQFIGLANGFFSHIFLCYKTEEQLYTMLKNKLIDKQNPENSSLSLYKDLEEFPHIEQFIDAEQMEKGKDEHYLVVFDDCVNDTKASKHLYFKLEKYFKFGRKKNLTTVFLTQSYFDFDLFMRKQINYLILTKLNNKSDLKRIIREFGSFYTTEEIYAVYLQMLKDDPDGLPFLLLNLNSKSEEEYISINFNDWLVRDKDPT